MSGGQASREAAGDSGFAFFRGATLAVLTAFTLLLVLPLVTMVWRSFTVEAGGDFGHALAVLAEPWLPSVLANTAIVVGASTLIAVAVGATLAWLNERTDANLGIVGMILPILPLLVPSIAMAIGWVFLAAPNVGFLNGISARLLGIPPASFHFNIYSWGGLIWVYSVHGVPFVYLVLSAAFRSFDPALEEASLIAGSGMLRTLRRVSIPAIRPAIVAAALMVSISGVALYTFPAIIGPGAKIDLLSARIVTLLTKDYPPKMGEAEILGLVMLLLVATFVLIQSRMRASGRFLVVGGRASARGRLPLGPWRGPARAAILLYVFLASALPLGALLLVSFQPFWVARINLSSLGLDNYRQALFIDRLSKDALTNSLLLSACGATMAMAVAAIGASYTLRSATLGGRIADAMMKLPATVPALVISASFLVTFSGAPFYLSGTLALLVLAYVVIYIPPGSIAANAAVLQIGRDVREASAISGAGDGRTMLRIELPLALPGYIAGWTIVFVHMMGDLSAAVLLASPGTPVIGYAILAIWETGSVGQLAAFTTIICLLITGVVLLMAKLSRFVDRRDA